MKTLLSAEEEPFYRVRARTPPKERNVGLKVEEANESMNEITLKF